ncbi:MAG: insulinase family protein [Spirochaetes bacterium]|jgi:predicted Zn-dependent peptidase|nr:insulinase family protein [Spirochaetota bacterium]
MKTIKIIFFILLLSLIPGIVSSAEINDAGKYLEEHVIQKTLDNGINIIMLNRGSSPTLALIISFRVGSVEESYGTIGTAHMLEHMLFKGTETVGTTDFAAEKIIQDEIELTGEDLDRIRMENPADPRIPPLKAKLTELQNKQAQYIVSSPYSKIYSENGGIDFNASTSRDMTEYYIQLPASKLELWARLESERLENPVFREFYLERDAVFEERLMRYESDGSSNLFEKFVSAAFITHPYRHPTIGWKSNIEYFSIKKTKEFYKTFYIPGRMVITVVGMHNPEETLKILQKYFGRLPKKDDPSPVIVAEPEQNGERRTEVYFEASPYIITGWHKPSTPSREDYIFDVISSILSDGRTSRLYSSLVIEKGIAASISAWNGYPGARYDNLFIIAGKPKFPHTAEDLEKAINEEVQRLAEDVKDSEIQTVLNRMESSFIFELDSNMGIAQTLDYYQTVFKDWKYAVNYLNVIKTINREEIKQVMKKYLTVTNRTTGILRDSTKREK